MRIRKFLSVGGIVALLVGVAMVATAVVATAEPTDKVTMCHHTGSPTNPFISITVDPSSIVKDSGHMHDALDIIPAFEYVDGNGATQNFPGLNVPAGSFNWETCTAAADPTPSASPTPTPSASPTPTPSASPTPTPSPTPKPSDPAAVLTPTPPAPTGAVLGESLALTGSNNWPLNLGILLVLFGVTALAASVITVRRWDS